MKTLYIVRQERRILDGGKKGETVIKLLKFWEESYAKFFNRTYTVKNSLNGPPFKVEKTELLTLQVPENYEIRYDL
jgi:hypothetical protein